MAGGAGWASGGVTAVFFSNGSVDAGALVVVEAVVWGLGGGALVEAEGKFVAGTMGG